MLAYTSTRRAMEKNHEGKRFKSAEAYRAMSLGEQPDATQSTDESQVDGKVRMATTADLEGLPRYELDLDSLTYTRV